MSVTDLRQPWGECYRLGRHFFVRDYRLGLFPVGKPYCMWCGIERAKKPSR